MITVIRLTVQRERVVELSLEYSKIARLVPQNQARASQIVINIPGY